ncbi:MAG: hypothetical protein HYY10_04440 [Candidatus Liptonbacteria bacterium]|nr:hypothetical protein [Candidatus Liptonbacteria bacterium]
MATVKTRINISLPDDVRDALAKLSRRDKVPQATKAVRLLEAALELEEDQVWDALAKRRDVKNARYLSHSQAWK